MTQGLSTQPGAHYGFRMRVGQAPVGNSPNPPGVFLSPRGALRADERAGWGRALPSFSKPPSSSITSLIPSVPSHPAPSMVLAEWRGRKIVACGSVDLGSGSAQPLPIHCCGTLEKGFPLLGLTFLMSKWRYLDQGLARSFFSSNTA